MSNAELVSVGLFLVVLASCSSVSRSFTEVERERVVAISAPCGMSETDAYEAYEAITRHDIAALAGLADRGKIITLEEGVLVHEYVVFDKLSRVRPTSGRHVGERCWIATGMLK